MKKISIFGLLLFTMFLNFGISSSQSGQDLFQRALVKERAEGNLEEAIILYQRVINESQDKALKAQAQLRIGLSFEKLGEKNIEQAQDAFRKVIDNYPSQSEEVKIAKEKLSLLIKAQETAKKGDEEFNLQKVWDDTMDSFFMGSPSPDGRYVTYVDWENFGNLGIRHLQKEKNKLLTHSDSWETGEMAYKSIFSPDGSRIAYTWQNTEGKGELRTIGIDGGTPQTILKDAGFPFPTSWSKDGSRILVFLRQKETVDIVFVSVKNGSLKKLRSFPSAKFAPQAEMSLSEDEQHIVFSMRQQEGSPNLDIHIMSSDGNNLTPLIVHPADDEVLGWTPDRKQVLFKSDRTGNMDLWTIQVEDGKPVGDPQFIRRAMGDIQPLGLTQDGFLYFGQISGWSDIFIAELDPETGKVLIPPVKAIKKYERSNSAPDWSSDGLYLVCRSSRGKNVALGGVALLIRSSQTEEIREVIPKNISGLNFHFIRWSPDGRTILGVGSDEKGNYGALWAIDAQTGESEIIARPDENGSIFQPSWAPDGQSIFFTRRTMKTRSIIHHEVVTGREKELLNSPNAIYNLTLSPDGHQLAFYADETIMLLSSNGGEPKKLLQEKDVNSIVWSSDGDFLLYGKRHDAKSSIVDVWRIPLVGGESQKLELSMLNLMHMRVHPDGRKIAFTGSLQPATSEVWVMENFLPKSTTKK